MSDAPSQLTVLLRAYARGQDAAFNELFTLIYGELKRLASRHLRGRPDGQTLNTTALVHESYVSLARLPAGQIEDRAHFLALASRIMRNILVDHVREKRAAKRGGGALRLTLTDAAAFTPGPDIDLLTVEQTIARLGAQNPRLERVAECKLFGGMTTPEIAAAVGSGTRTVEKDWAVARSYLHQALSAGGTR